MTTFYCDLRVYRNSDQHYRIVSIEVPAPDLVQAVQSVLSFKAGLAVHPNYETSSEESIYSIKRRGVDYQTMREAAKFLQSELLS